VSIRSTRRYNGFELSSDELALVDSDGVPFKVRRQTLDVFKCLAVSEGQGVSKQELFDEVWPTTVVGDDSLVKCISELRQLLSDDDRTTLETIPKFGYRLVADIDDTHAADGGSTVAPIFSRRSTPLVAGLSLLLLVFVGYVATISIGKKSKNQTTASIEGTPTVKLAVNSDSTSAVNQISSHVLPELRVALSRYQTLELSDADNTEYSITLADVTNTRLSVELKDSSSSVVYAESYNGESQPGSIVNTAQRIAASIASPGVGALDRQLLELSRLKPVENLTHAECFAHGFGCSKCSGEEDNITKRAEACLAHVLDSDPENARALALQATIYAHQYWWGNTLAEPLKSDLRLRQHLPAKAIEAANKAEALSVGDDSAIYWGMTEAYYSSCQADKMAVSIERGLEINPDDPNLLAAFGNWLSYSGRWDEGAAMTQRALEIEPQHYRKWWWMGLAKTHYYKEEFQEAYDDFLKSFNERNWISHLQFAYTLPYLDRLDEARHAVERLQDLAPQMTIEKALEHYEILCFPDSFLENMRRGLQMAGLQSRGNSDTFSDITLPRAKVMELSGYHAEYLEHGEGEPVVFVHGTLSDYRSWGYYLVPMSENHKFITYSRRYFGTQDWPDDGENFKSKIHGEDLIEFVEALDIGPVHLVSWSTGVIPAMLAALERPELFKSAIHYEPVDMAIFENQAVDQEQMDDWGQRWQAYDEAMDSGDLELGVQRFVEIVFQSGLNGFKDERESIKEVFRQNAATVVIEHAEPDHTRWTLNCDVVGQTTTPSLIVKGDQTHYFYARLAELFADCSDSQLVTILGVNHRGPLDAVNEMTEIVSKFVEKHKSITP